MKTIKPILLIAFLLLFIINIAEGATRTASGSGNWNSTATWGGNSVPGAGDVVNIERGYTVTVTANAACSALNFVTAATGDLGTLTINTGVTLTVGGATTMQNGTAAVSATINGAGTLLTTELNVGDGTNPGTFRTHAHTLTVDNATIAISGNFNIKSEHEGTWFWSGYSNGGMIVDSGTVTVNGNVTTTNENGSNVATLTLGNSSPNLVLNGATPFTISGTGTTNITLNGTGATVKYNRSGSQTAYPSAYTNLTLAGSGLKTESGLSVSGIMLMEGTATASAAPTYGSAATLHYKGSAVQTTGPEFPATFNGTGGVIIDNSNGVTLNAAKTIGTNSKLTLSLGKLNTTSSQLLTIANTSNSAVTGGSASSYVNGPLRWNLPAISSDINYVFPVGNNEYLPFTLLNPRTSGNSYAQAQAFKQNAGGSTDANLTSISTTEYWQLSTGGNFTSSSVALSRPTAITPFNAIAGSATKAGIYASLNGTSGTYGVTASDEIGNNRFFVFAKLRPIITVTPTTLTGFTYAEGNGPSQELTLTVNGSNLLSNIVILPPSAFEISRVSGAGFTSESPLTLTVGGGVVASTPIYVRMKAGFSQGTIAPQEIQFAATSADTVKVNASGTVTARPVLTVGTIPSNFTYLFGGGPSASQSFNVSGTNLQSNVIITAPSDFEVSTSANSGFSNAVTLNRVYNSGTGTYYLNSTPVYVRLITNLGAGTRSQVVQVSSTAALTKNVNVTGVVTSIATILNPVSLMGAFLYKQGAGPSGSQAFPVSGFNLTAGILVTSPTDYEVSLSSNSGFGSSVTLPQTGGIVNSTLVYVRLNSGLTARTLPIESIILTSAGATTKSIALRGVISPITTPTIAVSKNSLSGFGYQAAEGGPSPVQSFVVSGAYLSAGIVITAPADYEISASPTSGFGSTYTATRTSDRVDPKTIYVRLKSGKAAGDYTGVNITLTSSGATSINIPLTGKVFTSPLIQAGGGGGYCIGSTINLTSTNPDGSIQNLYWEGPNSYYSTVKNPVITNANTSHSGDYIVNANVVIGGNLITNGDFELGNTSFGSAYEYPPLPLNTSSLQPEGRYAIVDLPSQVHNNFSSSAPDHTPSPGTKQMVINGNTTPGAVVWSQTVNVIGGSDYEFTYWLQTVVNGNDPKNPSKLQLYVNGIAAGPVYTANPTTGLWTQFVYNTQSGSNTILNLELINQNTIAGGNDFALDDIVFQQILTATDTVNVNVNNTLPVSVTIAASANPVTQGSTVTYTATPTNGGATPSYQWKVNGVNVGTNSDTFSYVPNHGDVVTCVLTSSLQCTTNNPATSSSVTMTVNAPTNYWRGTNSEDWGTASNWTANTIPLAGDDVIYATVANYGSAAVRDLVLDQNRTIGSLINATIRRLIIPHSKTLIANNSVITDGNVDRIIIKAQQGSSNGSLIFNNAQNTPVKATVEMYSPASWDLTQPVNQKYNWQYFGIPLRSMPALPSLYASYVRKMLETGTTISNHWEQLQNESVLQPFIGYELCQVAPKMYQFSGELVNSNYNSGQLAVTSATALYPGQHLFANPYTAAMDIRQIEFGTSMEATVYLYNTGTFNKWDVGGAGGSKIGSTPGTYVSIPKNKAGNLGIPRQVPSMSSLLVRAISSNSNAYVKFTYSNVVMGNTEQQRIRTEEPQDTTVCTAIEIKGENTADKMWLFTGENYSRGFNNGSDGRKMLGSALNSQIFAVEEDGIYQVKSVDNIHNTLIAFQAGQDTEYEMVFTHENSASIYSKIYLHDLHENSIIDVTESGSTYHFEASSTPKAINRFRIITKAAETLKDGNSDISIFSSQNTLYIQNTGKEKGDIYVYDITGRMHHHTLLQDNNIHPIRVSGQNIFIVKIVTPKEEKVEKIFLNQ